MTNSAPEPQGQGKAERTPAGAGEQPSSGAQVVPARAELQVPSVPDHELLRCIGRGAYGAVWLARNVMGTYRAVKIVHREDFGQDRPFAREYEGLLKFEPISRSHPNLMQILHVGRRPTYFYYVTELADDAEPGDQRSVGSGQPGFVASYVPRTLQEDLERRGRLPARECMSLATALASALRHLHGHALVHRDVKPSNVIFVHGVPKLADIGLVATVGDSRSIVGTEGYLPPEGPGSPQADLYALGKLLYEVSTGLNRGHYPRMPPDVEDLPDAKELLEFNEILLRACARDTERRYHQADELLADLALLERGDSVKRLRRLERHHALLKRVGAGLLAVALLFSAAWWQTRRAHQIANRHLVQLHVDKGTQRMVEGDYAAALPWLVGALELEAGNPSRERIHRTRIANVLQRCPLPVAHFAARDSTVASADLNPDGTLLATAHDDGWVWLWDVRSGEATQQLPHKFPVVLCQFLPSGDRLLTTTVDQMVHLWDLTQPPVEALTLPQCAPGPAPGFYCVGLNEAIHRAYLAKARYCFARAHSFTGALENLTLSLKLEGKGEVLLATYQVRQVGPRGAVLYQGEFEDTPAVDPFDTGRDILAEPVWGRAALILENGSSGDSLADSGRVVWDNVRLRRYPTGQSPPPSWEVLDDFSSGSLTNWILLALAEAKRLARVENGQLALSYEGLPQGPNVMGWVFYREPLEISRTHTLEVEVDVVSAQTPRPMVNLLVGRYLPTALTAKDQPFIAHGRWLATTWWDGPTRLWDLEQARPGGRQSDRPIPPLELGRSGELLDIDFSPDTNFVALVGPTGNWSLWDFRTGLSPSSSVREGKVRICWEF